MSDPFDALTDRGNEAVGDQGGAGARQVPSLCLHPQRARGQKGKLEAHEIPVDPLEAPLRISDPMAVEFVKKEVENGPFACGHGGLLDDAEQEPPLVGDVSLRHESTQYKDRERRSTD